MGKLNKKIYFFLLVALSAAIVSLFASVVYAANVAGTGSGVLAKVPPGIARQLEQSGQADVLLALDDTDAKEYAKQMRKNLGLRNDNDAIIAGKARYYKKKKNTVLAGAASGGYVLLDDYENFPVLHLRVNEKALAGLLSMPEVSYLSENRAVLPYLTESLPLIGAPQAHLYGAVGTGTSVAVLDTGVNYKLGAFGSCSGGGAPADCLSVPPGPAGCSVACVHDFTPADDGFLDDDGHGTNVSGIVVGVAPAAKIIGLDVFRTDGFAYYSDIISALNWVLANKTTYNIVAVNMSLGGGQYNTPCNRDGLAGPITDLKTAGIAASVASGNDGYTSAMGAPACAPDAVSVGAVYDSPMGGLSWCLNSSCTATCTDATTAADKVTCFSNSASFLTLLAPGSEITSAGITMSGTSQAAPHVAGAVALLKGANGSMTVDDVILGLTNTGVAVTDSRNSLTKPRVDVAAAVSALTGTGTLTVNKTGSTGTGRITSSPAGIDCGTSCALASASYSQGTPVTLTAQADANSTFAGWSGGGCSGTGTCGITISAAATVTALFNLKSPVANFSGSPVTGDALLTVNFTDTSTNNPTSWSWTFGDGGTSTLQNPAYTYQNPGTYAVSLTATNAGGSSTTTKTGYITVTSLPIRISGTPPSYYSLLTAAYGAAAGGSIIQGQTAVFTEDLDCIRSIPVTLKGGYDATFTGNSGFTTINGSLTISAGTVTLENIVIK